MNATTTFSGTTCFSICRFKGKTDKRPQTAETTWSSFCSSLQKRDVREDKDGPLFSPVVYKPDTTRASANVVSVSCLVLDGDEAGRVEDFMEDWNRRGLAYVVYSTHSHTPEEPRWRVVIPLSHPVTVSEWKPFYQAATQVLGGSLVDGSCKDPSRMFFNPSCPPGMEQHAFCYVGEGRALDPQEIVVPPPPPKTPFKAAPQTRRVTPSCRESFFTLLLDKARQERQAERSRNKGGYWLAQQLRDNQSGKDYSEADARAVMMTYQQEMDTDADHPYPWTEAEATFNAVFAQPARAPWTERAQPSVWTESAKRDDAHAGNSTAETPSDDAPENAEKTAGMRLDNSGIPELLPPADDAEPEEIGKSLSAALATMEYRIRREGATPDRCGISLPPDLDVEAVIKVGTALKAGEGRINTLLFFAWADWYRAVQTYVSLLPEGKKKGRAVWILGRVYLGCPAEYIAKRRDQLSDMSNVLRKIENVVTREYRDMTRSTRFYELLSNFPPERQAYWWDQPREIVEERDGKKIRIAVTTRMLEELIALRTPPTVAEEGEEDPAVGHEATATSPPLYSDPFGGGTPSSLHFENIVSQDSDDALHLSGEAVALLRTMQLDAVQRGVSIEEYLRAKLFNAPLPEPTDGPNFAPNTLFDGDLISRACVHIETEKTEKPRHVASPPEPLVGLAPIVPMETLPRASEAAPDAGEDDDRGTEPQPAREAPLPTPCVNCGSGPQRSGQVEGSYFCDACFDSLPTSHRTPGGRVGTAPLPRPPGAPDPPSHYPDVGTTASLYGPQGGFP